TVNTTPGRGAIAQWEASTMRHDGHVAYVESYTTSGGSVTSITVSEDNWSAGPFAWKTITAGSTNWPDHFIHFKDLPELSATLNPLMKEVTAPAVVQRPNGETDV